MLSKGKLPSPFRTILNLLIISHENEAIHTSNRMDRNNFSTIENIEL